MANINSKADLSHIKGDTLALSPDYYGPFWKYVEDPEITDCDYNGSDLWITDSHGRRQKIDNHGITDLFVKEFSQRVANHESKQFNKMEPLLEAETGTLRISILHESVTMSGRSICLRKTLPQVRITERKMIEEDYLQREIINLLVNCIDAKMNFVIGGEPGAGKTEFAKYISQFIPSHQRVITIEDSPEWHYKELNPGKDCVEMQIIPGTDKSAEIFSYAKAIKTCLRQNPKWIMLSEARSIEVKYLIESWSTGVNGITTIHTDDIRNIPSRMLNMMANRDDAERLNNDIYEFANVVMIVRRKQMADGTAKRYIDQVGFLYGDKGRNNCHFIVKNGQVVDHRLPATIAYKLQRAEVENPYEDDKIDARLGSTYKSEFGYELLPTTEELERMEAEFKAKEIEERKAFEAEKIKRDEKMMQALVDAASRPATVAFAGDMSNFAQAPVETAVEPEPEPVPEPEPEPVPEPPKPATVLPKSGPLQRRPSANDLQNIRQNMKSSVKIPKPNGVKGS